MNLDTHRILVTGGAGFVGSHVVRALADRGASLTVVDDFTTGGRDRVPADATLHAVDIRDDALRDVVADVEPTVIVHLAAHHYIPYCNAHPEETFEVNVMGTRNLLAAARECDALERLVFASSAAVYPVAEGPFDEDHPTGPTDVYGRTKLVGEDLCRLFATDTGVSTAVARLFNVYGRMETNDHIVPAVVAQLRAGGREVELGNVVPKRDFVHVSDVARALCAMITEFDGAYRTFNVGTGTEYSIEELVARIGDALGGEVDITRGERRVRVKDRLHLCADASRAAAELGWEPRVSLTEGLRDVLAEAGLVADSERPEVGS